MGGEPRCWQEQVEVSPADSLLWPQQLQKAHHNSLTRGQARSCACIPHYWRGERRATVLLCVYLVHYSHCLKGFYIFSKLCPLDWGKTFSSFFVFSLCMMPFLGASFITLKYWIYLILQKVEEIQAHIIPWVLRFWTSLHFFFFLSESSSRCPLQKKKRIFKFVICVMFTVLPRGVGKSLCIPSSQKKNLGQMTYLLMPLFLPFLLL